MNMTSIKNLSELINRFDEICEIAQQEEVIINIDKGRKGVALISLSKLQQIQEIEKSFRHLQRALQINRIQDNAEPGGTWDEFLSEIDEGLAADVVKQPADDILTKISSGMKLEISDY
jgi:hypothetical protein